MIAVTHKSWIAEYLDVPQHFGMDIVDTSQWVTGKDGMWCPGHYMGIMGMLGSAWVGTHVPYYDQDELVGWQDVCDILEVSGPQFVKLPEFKDDKFDAAVYTYQTFRQTFATLPCADLRSFLVKSPREGIYRETRHWVVDGEHVQGKVYRHGSDFYSGEDMGPASRAHVSFAKYAIGDLPMGTYTIDIGQDRLGMFVIETNPAWCSGFYDADPEVVKLAIIKSQGRVHEMDGYHVWGLDSGTVEALKHHRLYRENVR